MEQKPYMTYLNFGENVVSLIGHIISICLFSRLTYYGLFQKQRLKVAGFSGSMYVYMITHIVLACTSLLYLLYVIARWCPNTITQYDKNVMYWLGLVDSNYIYITPVPVLFLTLDRIFSYMCAEKYGHVQRRRLLVLTLCCILFSYLGFSTVTLLELPLQQNKVAECVNFACMMVKFGQRPQLYCKLGIGCINIFLSFFFFYRINNSTVKNIVILFIVIFLLKEAPFLLEKLLKGACSRV
uniref:G-protein coupled receptors family 1 profile domain-containing protein n=2 Tax=Ditylenchus dipsaci TaxID=166011 RepID=A0A915EUY7_9BILA